MKIKNVNDVVLGKILLKTEMVASFSVTMPIFCSFNIGSGDFARASIWYSLYALCLIYVKYNVKVAKKRLQYLEILETGKPARGRWEGD
jgi:hypothetical protein